MSEVMSGYTYIREYRAAAGNEAGFPEHDRPGGTRAQLFRRGSHARPG